jgi:hypothetical protein
MSDNKSQFLSLAGQMKQDSVPEILARGAVI